MTSFSGELIKFASQELSINEKQILGKVIDQILVDLTLGHSCSSLSAIADIIGYSLAELQTLLKKSDLVGEYTDNIQIAAKPLVIYHELLYITRYFAYEFAIAHKVKLLSKYYGQNDGLPFSRLFQELSVLSGKYGLPNSEQLAAIKESVFNQLSIITGGPGTGKTTTVTLLLWLLIKLYDDRLPVIKICAPTGKAANRVKESITGTLEFFSKSQINIDYQILTQLLTNSAHFSTIHKLLGYQQNKIYFKHDATNPLEVDILIIDESSMIGLPLFGKLLDAIDPQRTRHIIFLGDRNQLSSVEEGYVFASLVNNQNGNDRKQNTLDKVVQPDLFNQPILFDNYSYPVSQLASSNRNQGDIASLATAVLNEDTVLATRILQQSKDALLHSLSIGSIMGELFAVDGALTIYAKRIFGTAEASVFEYGELFNHFNQHIVLCATNVGRFGTLNLNLLIEKKLKLILGINQEWYTGRPVLIMSNDYSLGIFNGDIGICQIRNDQPYIVFPNGLELIPEILPQYQLAYAMTIHKSQGSEYQCVSIVLPESSGEAAMYSRELIYTAITRAKQKLKIFGKIDYFNKIIKAKLARNSGLEIMLKSTREAI